MMSYIKRKSSNHLQILTKTNVLLEKKYLLILSTFKNCLLAFIPLKFQSVHLHFYVYTFKRNFVHVSSQKYTF